MAARQNWTALVRWDAPASPNGIVAHYRLVVWQGDGGVFSNTTVNGTGTEALLSGLSASVTYSAEVRRAGSCFGR